MDNLNSAFYKQNKKLYRIVKRNSRIYGSAIELNKILYDGIFLDAVISDNIKYSELMMVEFAKPLKKK